MFVPISEASSLTIPLFRLAIGYTHWGWAISLAKDLPHQAACRTAG